MGSGPLLAQLKTGQTLTPLQGGRRCRGRKDFRVNNTSSQTYNFFFIVLKWRQPKVGRSQKGLKNKIHISIESGPDNFECFFFALRFLVLLELFCWLISGKGCVLWRCFWMAASGSDSNSGSLRTASNRLLSFILINNTTDHVISPHIFLWQACWDA